MHPFTVRNNLLIIAESKRTRQIGWTSTFINILHFPLVIRLIKETGKIEGIIHSLLITVLVGINYYAYMHTSPSQSGLLSVILQLAERLTLSNVLMTRDERKINNVY